jgi:hypothetical protein
MEYSSEEIELFTTKYIDTSSNLFKPKSRLHYKWYSVKNDELIQYGLASKLFESNPEQIIFETYDHGKPTQVEVFFFDVDLNEINAIKLSNNWSIGKRLSDKTSDKKYQIFDPSGKEFIVELGSNLYSKVWKTILNKTTLNQFK